MKLCFAVTEFASETFSTGAAAECRSVFNHFWRKNLINRVVTVFLVISAAFILPSKSDAQDALTHNEIFELQFHLSQLGYYTGSPDGHAGRQTTAAVKAYGTATGARGEMSETLLSQVREATKDIEGLVKGHGEIDFLVFTDQGTPLIFAVEKIGRIYKDESQKIIRDYDVDGLPIYSNVFAVSHVDPTLDIPLLAGVAFGYQVRVPTPPSGERLQINHVVVWPERLEDGSTKTSTYSYEHIYLKREGNPRYWFHHFEKKPSDRYKGNWSIRLENRGTVLLSRTFVLGTPAASAAGLQYQDLPAAVKTYAENVRNSCKDYNPGGIPADKMSGITLIALSDSTPALLIDNEALCSDHYSGANCSNRGCDVVVMIEADKGWKEIFHEHLYEKTFNIVKDRKLKSIAASVYAGDPHCGAAPGSKFMSSDSCSVRIRYEHKTWNWQKVR